MISQNEQSATMDAQIALLVGPVLAAAATVLNLAALSPSAAAKQRRGRDAAAAAATQRMNTRSKEQWGDGPLPVFFHPRTAALTGSEGMVGRRTAAVLAAGGRCKRIVCCDVLHEPPDFKERAAEALQVHGCQMEYVQVDICDRSAMCASDGAVQRAMRGVEALIHIAALVGPYFPKEAYYKVNYEGTLRVIEACRVAGVGALVDCSSPSTRFDGNDICGLDEASVWARLGQSYYGLHAYATTKAMGEAAALKASGGELSTCAIAPHQVYGPSDNLFLPGLLQNARRGTLRVMGYGHNLISFTHEANIAHALALGAGV